MVKIKLRVSLGEGCVLVFVAFVLYFFSMFLGIPIHDFNLWRLEQRYKEIKEFHPAATKLVKPKKYLGGPDEHGSWACVYAVGEIRRTKLTKQDIQKAYKHVPAFGTPKYPAKFEIHFSDFTGMPLFDPLSTWLYDLEAVAKSASTSDLFYLIYTGQENIPFWGDTRCDD